MALIQGEMHLDLLQYDHRANRSASVQNDGYPLTRANNYLNNDAVIEGTKTYNPQTGVTYPISGELAKDFFSEFYSRIYFIPNPLDLGEVVTDDSGKFMLWNASIHNNTVNTITVAGLTPDTNFDSDFFTVPTPLEFSAIENKFYGWMVEKNGDDEISVEIGIASTLGDFSMLVKGKRGVFFSASPLKDFTHEYSFKTRITESFNHEQRSSLSTIPQETFTYKAVIRPEDRFNFQANLQDAARLTVSIPMWEDYMVHGDVPINTTYIENADGDFLGRPFYEGGIAVLWQNEVRFNLVKVKTIAADGTRIDFERPTEVALTNAFLIPVRSGVLVDPVKLNMDGLNRNIVEVSISTLEHQPNFDRTVSLETFQDRYVLTSPNFQSSTNDQFGVDYDTFEGVGGDRSVFLDRGYRMFKSKYVWKCFDRESLNELREFIFATRGKWKAFWLPRFGNDLTLHTPALKDQTFIECDKSQYTTDVRSYIGQAMMVHRHDGTREYYKIVNFEYQQSSVRLSLDSPLPSDLDQSDIFHMCIMDLVRLSSDKPKVKVKDISDISCSLSVTGVNDD